ncbi:putative integral membrane protein, Mpv17/PMP22 family [Dissophora ornata]|nr:putative integral membrane protein, Mpv17/PMP22 family [Dissophora ornata]
MATVLKSAYAFYNRQYQARPILTICTTNAILAGISDTLTQNDYQAIEEHQPTSDSTSISTPSLDFARMGRFMFYNFSVAPLIHTWYSFLEKNFPINITSPSSSVNSSVKSLPAPSSRLIQTMTPALKRMVADQTLFAPAGLALLFTGLTVLEGGGVQEIKDKLNNNYLTTLKANYAVWPIVQLVNFSLMPLQLRLPFVSVVGIAWNAYLR